MTEIFLKVELNTLTPTITLKGGNKWKLKRHGKSIESWLGKNILVFCTGYNAHTVI